MEVSSKAMIQIRSSHTLSPEQYSHSKEIDLRLGIKVGHHNQVNDFLQDILVLSRPIVEVHFQDTHNSLVATGLHMDNHLDMVEDLQGNIRHHSKDYHRKFILQCNQEETYHILKRNLEASSVVQCNRNTEDRSSIAQRRMVDIHLGSRRRVLRLDRAPTRFQDLSLEDHLNNSNHPPEIPGIILVSREIIKRTFL